PTPIPAYPLADMSALPIAIERQADDRIAIRWSDGSCRDYSARELRDHCPCASCKEKGAATPAAANLLPVITVAEAAPLHIEAMKPVGNYAYGIVFSDGHSSGIFTMALLHKLGTLREPP